MPSLKKIVYYWAQFLIFSRIYNRVLDGQNTLLDVKYEVQTNSVSRKVVQ